LIDIDNSFWNDVAVRKVIQNEVYIGSVIAGKSFRPNMNERRFKQRPKSEWICVPDMHEPIVTKEDFELANKMICMPRRKKNEPKERYLYAKVRCHCCKHSLIRQKGIAPLYICGTPRFKPSPNCVTEPVSEIDIEEVLLSAIQAQANSVLDMDKARIKKNKQIASKKQEHQKAVRRYDGMISSLIATRQDNYERLKDEQISRDEFLILRDSINEQIDRLNIKIEETTALIADCDALTTDMAHTVAEWHKALSVERLSKELVDALVDSIIVFDSEHIEIRWKFADEYAILGTVKR